MNVEQLKEKSKWLRRELFEMVVRSKKGHIPSSYSCIEMIIALFYGGYFNHSAQNPSSPDRDRILISKGHAAMVLYPVLADLGYFPASELEKFTKPDGLLRMYGDNSIPGIESITGSLGHGFGIGTGFALRAKRDYKNFKTYVILGDGECYEGSIWEAAMFASHHELDNLIAIVDRNKLCIMDETEKCIRLESLEQKWEAFGWHTLSINAHSYEEVLSALEEVKQNKTKKPVAIIAHSIKGKGISFMENQPLWHNRMPSELECIQAREEIEKGIMP